MHLTHFVTTIRVMPLDSENNRMTYPESYSSHKIFEELEYYEDFYDAIAFGCHHFVPNGVETMLNYTSYIFNSIQCTLDSIKLLFNNGRISDAYVLIRKLFDDILVEIYIDILRKDNFDYEENIIVKDANEWIKGKHRIPYLKKLLKTIEDSPTTKDLYPFFGWDTYLVKDRELLDDSVHSNKFCRILLNCDKIYMEEGKREKYLDYASKVLKHVFTLHLSFSFYLNPQYLMASTYIDYLDEGAIPPKGSENWIANYAQEAFDKFIKPDVNLATFIKNNCRLQII